MKWAYFWKASATWMASSRVGVSTSTWGLLSLGSMRASNGSAEGCGLAGTGLGLAHHVLAFEQQLDTGGLDGDGFS